MQGTHLKTRVSGWSIRCLWTICLGGEGRWGFRSGPMSRGLSLRPCCRPGPKPEDLGWRTARSSTGSWMCGLQAAGGAIGLAHMAPIRRPGGGFGNFKRRGSGERSCQPFWTGGIRWGRGRWRRWRLIPRGWRRKKGGRGCVRRTDGFTEMAGDGQSARHPSPAFQTMVARS
jgi:hypothetical protein